MIGYRLPLAATCLMLSGIATAQDSEPGALRVGRCADFAVTGGGNSPAWGDAPWVALQQRGDRAQPQQTRIKALYSDTGVYFLFDCEDTKLSATMLADNMELWREDVIEVFLAPDPGSWDHFEYELSPLNYQLPLLVARRDGALTRWIPFHVAGDNDPHIVHAIAVRGGDQLPGATVTGWTAECYIPYTMLGLFRNTPPRKGTQWRANFYRVDYDDGRTADWTWRPVAGTYHNPDEYGILIFE